jgi:hypothetical protein
VGTTMSLGSHDLFCRCAVCEEDEAPLNDLQMMQLRKRREDQLRAEGKPTLHVSLGVFFGGRYEKSKVTHYDIRSKYPKSPKEGR